MKIKVICANCKKEYELSKTLYNKRIKRNNALYCSMQCFYKSRIKKEKTFCYNCGKEILKTPYRINKTKNGKNFCSKSCANSYNNTLRKKESINTYRRIAFEVYEHKCAICGWDKDERILEVHHKDENRKNNKIDNLIILCPICHRYLTLHIKTIEELLIQTERRVIMKREFDFVERIRKEREDEVKMCIKLPERSTAKSAGYDFFAIEDVVCKSHQITMIPTGIKAKFPDDETLLLFNRSSNPKKKGLIILNGVGVVDADYYGNPDNDGEIAGLFYNMRDEDVKIEAGEKIMQGMFVKYAITDDDNAEGERIGGFGSTGK